MTFQKKKNLSCQKWNLFYIGFLYLLIFNYNLIFVESMMNEEVSQMPTLPPSSPAPQASVNATGIEIEKTAAPANPCFYAEPELCYRTNTEIIPPESLHCQHCRQHPNQLDALICCNITDIKSQVKDCIMNRKFKYVHIRNLTVGVLNIPLLNSFKESTSLAITDGNITKLNDSFTQHSNLKCLNISNNNLTEITEKRALKELISNQLKILDLSYNNLNETPNLNSHKNLSLNIRGNKRMVCSSVTEAIEKGNTIFIDPNNTSCYLNQTYTWFNSTELVSVSQLISVKQIHIECPIIRGYGNCSCNPEQMIFTENSDVPHLISTVKVDCSNMGLKEFPEKLPKNTIKLIVSNNNITDFGNRFHSNRDYDSIIILDADNNQISSMYELEGSKFIEEFQTFFLRRNLIDKIPEYLLSNALDNNRKGRALYLGGNKVTCDCNSAKVLKLWLLARQNNIPDYGHILCNNMPQKVIDLTEIKLCQSVHDWTDYIYYLIALEVFLLVALIMKVSYDYYKFKTSGYLPWPANKMPKLPCDWLCES